MPSRNKPAKLAARKSVRKKPAKANAVVKRAQTPAKKVAPKPKQAKMAERKPSDAGKARSVERYEHPEKKRLNNPPVGLVTPETDPDRPKKSYAFDPHLDPQLTWAGKEEKTALILDTVSLHVHERIDPFTIMEAVRNKASFVEQPSLFEQPSENLPLREALDFYKHQHEWSNRLIAGDSALVMNSLIEREGMAGQVQMIYIDPPYGIRYRSNFQPFINNRNVADTDKDDDLTAEPEMVRAFRDTWELGVHSYLTYLRDRLRLAHSLLAQSGSIFVQISDENLHRITLLLDEVFGSEHFVAVINYITASPRSSKLLENNCNYVVWYARDKATTKFRSIFRAKPPLGDDAYKYVELTDGSRRLMSPEERSGRLSLPNGAKIFRLSALTSTRIASPAERFSIEVDGKTFPPGKTMWQTTPQGIERLKNARRIAVAGSTPQYVRYLDDFPAFPIGTQWTDTSTSGFSSDKKYVVQTNPRIIERCMLMTTDPGDLVLDPTCGSGTTAVVAEQFGRRWITCDTSRVALGLSRQRLLAATFDYYDLLSPDLGVDGGFRYKTVTHIKLGTIANDEPIAEEPMFDQPLKNAAKVRVTGPFTVEAVPAPMVAALNSNENEQPDASLGRSGPTIRESDLRGEILKSGVRGLGGKAIRFSRVEPLAGTTFLQADGETIEENPQRVVISFGPDYAPLEQRQVQGAWKEAQTLNPAPTLLLFVAFQFDPEAAKDIDEMKPALAKMTFLKVQMNTDILTADLKKKSSTNESFWLIGRPDIELRNVADGDHKKYVVEVHGFDYYDVKSGEIISGDASKIAMWMLDPDYDDRSLFPRQVFFPMADEKSGWAKLANNLKAELDEDLMEAYRGMVSLPFEGGKYGCVAVKIVDDRGVESLRVVRLP